MEQPEALTPPEKEKHIPQVVDRVATHLLVSHGAEKVDHDNQSRAERTLARTRMLRKKAMEGGPEDFLNEERNNWDSLIYVHMDGTSIAPATDAQRNQEGVYAITRMLGAQEHDGQPWLTCQLEQPDNPNQTIQRDIPLHVITASHMKQDWEACPDDEKNTFRQEIINMFQGPQRQFVEQYLGYILDSAAEPTISKENQQALTSTFVTRDIMTSFVGESYRGIAVPEEQKDESGNTTNQEDIDAATQHNTTVEQQREQATSQLGTELLPRADMIAEMVTEVAHLQGCDAISDEQITDVQRELNDLQAQLNQYKNQSDSSEESNKQIPWLEQQIEKKIIELQSLQTAKEQMAKHGGYENVAKLFFQRLEAGLIPAEVATQVRYHLEQGNINELNKIMFAQLHLDTLDKEGRQAMENRLKTLSELPPWASVLLGMALVLGLKLAEETGRAT